MITFNKTEAAGFPMQTMLLEYVTKINALLSIFFKLLPFLFFLVVILINIYHK